MKKFKIIYVQESGIQGSIVLQANSKAEAKGKWLLQQGSHSKRKIVQVYEV